MFGAAPTIRTTFQALYALFNNCHFLHTNAYAEVITTPTEEPVRRAVAVDALTNLVAEALYKQFEAISERGGVLGSFKQLQATALERKNLFEALMEAVKYHSIRQVSHALYEVGRVSEEYVASKS